MELKEISKLLKRDTITNKLINGETLSLKELYLMKNKLDQLIQEHVLQDNK